MDAIKILGSLLSSGALSGGSAGNVLGNILGSALGGSSNRQGGGMADVLGSLLGGAQNSNQGGLGNVLGSLLGGQQANQNQGGLGNVLGSLLGGQQSNQNQGGLGNVLGSLLGGAQQNSSASAGGLGGLLGGLMGGQQGGQGGGGLADLLTGAVSKYMQSQDPNVPDLSSKLLPNQQAAEQQATLIIRAMVNSAKADGTIDQQEQERIIGKLGNISDSEADFIRKEFEAPLDVAGFVRSVPPDMAQQIYAISLAAIDLDTRTEAQYLSQLAQGLNLSPEVCNALHEQVGAPKLYS
ncbi:DUF533 domain-containing protein [uncultured Thiothrix sp.]|mgnify:FL=1|uniref:tellurite resistance TerB family protein n=1 Tax=uncultured Thiothrix sp. TaxID=223185 RepID=UPI0026358F7F|nr:DUF533 domain-containing protein [uncultured Thiothrix sp.]